MTSNSFYPCGEWIPRGVAAANPDRIRLEPEQLRNLISEAKSKANQLSAGNQENQSARIREHNEKEELDDDDIAAEYGLDEYDDDMNVDPVLQRPDEAGTDNEDGSEVNEQDLANELAALTYYPSNEDDPYLRPSNRPDDDSEDEAEDLKISPTDNLIVMGHVSKGSSELEVYVYNRSEEEFYLHHDVLLAEYPCCVRWLSRARGADGNYAIVGNMSSGIEIWNLDIVDGLEPVARLRGHKGAVIDICCNKQVRHRVASGGADRTIRTWNMDTMACDKKIYSIGEVVSLQFDPNSSETLVAGDLSKNIVLYELTTGTPMCQWKLEGETEKLHWPENAVNESSKSTFYASDDKGYVYAFDGRKLDNKRPIFRLKAHDDAVSGLVTSSRWPHMMLTGSADQSIKVWDLSKLDPKSNCPLLVKTIDHLKVGKVLTLSVCLEEPVISVGGDGKSNSFRTYDLSEDEIIKEHFNLH